MRLDKFLCQLNIGTRSEVKTMLRKGFVTVNGAVVKSSEQKIDEEKDIIAYKGQILTYRKFVYYIMNKPANVVTATTDNRDQTVLDLLLPAIGEQDRKRNIVPCGRLDKDTEGLLLLTDDGELVHELLSPKKHVNKTYLVHMLHSLSPEDIKALENGVDIGEKHLTLPAVVTPLSENQILLTIQEGKFHQVKRMLQAVNNQVTALKRVRFGPLKLEDTLLPGTSRELTDEEIRLLKNRGEETGPNTIPSLDGVEAVLFDLDGTLVDSMWIWREIDIEYLNRFGLNLPDTLQSEIEGMSFKETAIYFKNKFRIPDSLEVIMQNWNDMAWDMYATRVPLKPGAKTFLDLCRQKGIKLGIATSNSRELAENVTKVHRIQDYFDCIMTGSDVEKGKPAPDIYLEAARKLNVNPSNCLVFEDICPGIKAGQNAGMRVCAIDDAYSASQWETKKALADYYINDYSEIKDSI